MSDIVQFNYEGNPISFEFNDGLRMINATEMAKPFSKSVSDFLRLKGTKDYIEVLTERYKAEKTKKYEILRVIKGGDPNIQGTWMDERLALKFASWLAPAFEVWVYEKIQDLLINGHTLMEKPMTLGEMFKLQAELWMKQEEVNRQIQDKIKETETRIDQTEEKLNELEAKITSVDENYYTIAGYCSLHKIDCPLYKAKAWGKAATQLSRAKGVATGIAHDERYGRVRTYHKDILAQVI